MCILDLLTGIAPMVVSGLPSKVDEAGWTDSS
jgi:hypothetical protein